MFSISVRFVLLNIMIYWTYQVGAGRLGRRSGIRVAPIASCHDHPAVQVSGSSMSCRIAAAASFVARLKPVCSRGWSARAGPDGLVYCCACRCAWRSGRAGARTTNPTSHGGWRRRGGGRQPMEDGASLDRRLELGHNEVADADQRTDVSVAPRVQRGDPLDGPESRRGQGHQQ